MQAIKDFFILYKANWKSMLIYGAVSGGIGFAFGGGIIGKIVAMAFQ